MERPFRKRVRSVVAAAGGRRSDALRSTIVLGSAAIAFGTIAGHGVLSSGYVLQVDTTWGPHSPPLQAGFYRLIALLARVGVRTLGGATSGKIYVLAVLVLCAAGPMVALRRHPLWVRALCGAVGVFNPWVYERIVEGQWTVAAAGASLFLWLAAFDHFEERPGPFGAALVALTSAVVVAFSPGFIAMLAILAGSRVAFGVHASGKRSADLEDTRERRRWLTVAVLLTTAVLIVGALQFAFGHGAESYERVKTFGAADLKFFRSQGSPHGLPVRLLGLSGFWAERTGRFEPLDAGAAWWPAAALALCVLVFLGAWMDRARSWLLVAGTIGLVISGSTAIAPARDAVAFVDRHVPVLFGFREPEKFAALWLVAVVMLLGSLLTALDRRARAIGSRAGLFAAVAATIAVVLALGGAREPQFLARTLRPVAYPEDWYSAARYLRAHPGGRTAVLPWHHYLGLSFARGRVVQNPADVFFPGDLLVSQDPEISTTASGPAADIRDAAAAPRPAGCRLGRALRAHGVHHVVVLPTLEGPTELADLLHCGFTLVHGTATTVAVARADEKA